MHWRFAVLVLAALLAAPTLAGPSRTVVLDVQNMTCSLCPITVKKSLQKVPGVADAKVDLSRKTATVSFDPDKTGAAAMIRATTEAGFPATLHQ